MWKAVLLGTAAEFFMTLFKAAGFFKRTAGRADHVTA